jgi:hypothetical protein
MLATLDWHESRFGPYHPQTLGWMTHVAIACWRAGQVQYARPLLEKAVADLGRHVDRNHELRLQAITTLKDVLLSEHEYGRAAEVERELLERQTELLGSDHPETLATRADLATILMERVACMADRQV